MRARIIQTADLGKWDAFVLDCPGATFFHLSGWKRILEEAFGHATYYLMAEENGDIRGVLPLGQLKSRLFGNHLVSTPFCVYGGPISLDSRAEEVLVAAACDLARKLRVDDLEIRSLTETVRDWPGKDLYVTFRKHIDPDHDVNMKSIPRKQRAMVRKGLKAGLSFEQVDNIEDFYQVYAESVRNLGTPVFGRKYFELLKEEFGNNCNIHLVRHGKTIVSGVMSFRFCDQILPYYAGSLPIARNLKANDFMYWKLMCQAACEGTTEFDYGRSKVGTGNFSFKKNWGFEPHELHYEYFLVKADEVPRVDPTNPKYKALINLWKRAPLLVTNNIGPLLARNLG